MPSKVLKAGSPISLRCGFSLVFALNLRSGLRRTILSMIGSRAIIGYHRPMTMPPQAAHIAPSSSDAIETAALSPAASLFRSLGDATRLAILRHLALGELRVVDLNAHLGMAQSTVSAHLACLKDCGLVSSRPQGRASLWSLAAQPELLTLLAAAEQLLELTGDAVDLCPTYGSPATAKEIR